jgi:hypothetical protein
MLDREQLDTDLRELDEVCAMYRARIDELRSLRHELQAEISIFHAVLDRARQLSRDRSVARESDPLQ